MRHRKKSEGFSRPRAQQKALINALLRAVIIHEAITTTDSRARYLRGQVDRLITRAKEDSLAARRRTYRKLKEHKLVKRLFEVIAPRFKAINGGYTRMIYLPRRKGDGAQLCRLELTKRESRKKAPKVKKDKAAQAKGQKDVPLPEKEEKSKRGILSGVKKIFKRERDTFK